MAKRVHSSVVIAALTLLAVLTMGVESCSEPKEYCKFYGNIIDQKACTNYCETNRNFAASPKNSNLIRACQLGQLGYLSNVRVSAAEAMLGCDRKFKDDLDQARACREGVTAEELRVSKSRSTPGTSQDRETGNNH